MVVNGPGSRDEVCKDLSMEGDGGDGLGGALRLRGTPSERCKEGSLVLSLSESGLGLATTRMGRCGGLRRGARDLASSAMERKEKNENVARSSS